MYFYDLKTNPSKRLPNITEFGLSVYYSSYNRNSLQIYRRTFKKPIHTITQS